MKAEA